jgi:nucleoid-associated protein EbfC
MTNRKMFGDIMKQAQQMQERLAKLQEEAGKKTIEASVGGGMVTVVANGKQEILSVKIDPEVLSGNDKAMIEDLVVAAINEALRKARDLMAEEMKSLTGGLQIPGLF